MFSTIRRWAMLFYLRAYPQITTFKQVPTGRQEKKRTYPQNKERERVPFISKREERPTSLAEIISPCIPERISTHTGSTGLEVYPHVTNWWGWAMLGYLWAYRAMFTTDEIDLITRIDLELNLIMLLAGRCRQGIYFQRALVSSN